LDILSEQDPQDKAQGAIPPARIIRVSVSETRPLGAYKSLRLGAEAEIVGLERPEEVIHGLRTWLGHRFEEMIR
jgi:hypothetical protein